MKFILMVAGALLSVGVAPTAAAQEGAQGGTAAPAGDEESSRAAVAAVDAERLMTDREYAAQILDHIERLDRDTETVERRAALDTIRLIALTTAQRREEVAAAIDRHLARGEREPSAYAGPIFAAMLLQDHARTVAVVEAASRNVPGIGRPELREMFDVDTMGQLLYELRARNENGLRVRLAEALFQLGWPGNSELQSADTLRVVLVEDRMARGDRADATAIAEGISTTGATLPLIVQTRFDPVLAPGRDRLELLREALAREDSSTAESLRLAPDNPEKILARVHYLRSVGRDEDALALMRPFREDLGLARASEDGLWLINESVYALIALDRMDEAVALMERLLATPLAESPTLISMSINYIGILYESGRHAAALEHALRLHDGGEQFASDYGDMWISSWIACSLTRLGRAGEAAPHLQRVRERSAANPAALTLAYLCTGDMTAAEALMIERLGGNDPATAILAFQDYALSRGESQAGDLYERLLELRDRPAVRAALARVGRVLTLPLSRSYWGNF